MLSVGLLGSDAAIVGARLDALDVDHRIDVVRHPDPVPERDVTS
jgi:hypothetical protein